ncbi:hypothetical protein [Lysinibacillus sp. SGAir0095]|uniref:hypothetical protein n=1 Tax=Lysinibacillus sp. SGAir0095 TaxID=2070463 RepID=UPI0010CCEB24|nr:hypothetical protein [Lysinibacillus sp. SGAir0095]QCR33119.1 hypothetical protein C1N55_13425 [Lysinibacillus sp. SGAir0095]
MIKPNPKSDELVLKEEIHFTIDGMPTMNFSTGQLDSFSTFHYDVKLYKNAKGKKYYLFNCYKDCTLFIMNCNQEIYELLEKIIPINDDIEIFEHSPGKKGLEFVAIPEEYRKTSGFSGSAIIFTD